MVLWVVGFLHSFGAFLATSAQSSCGVAPFNLGNMMFLFAITTVKTVKRLNQKTYKKIYTYETAKTNQTNG